MGQDRRPPSSGGPGSRSPKGPGGSGRGRGSGGRRGSPRGGRRPGGRASGPPKSHTSRRSGDHRQNPLQQESPVREGDRAGARLAKLDEIEVKVEKLVAGGDGLARFEGIPIFIPRSAPGDRLKVRLVERRPSYGKAEIVEILSPGDHRRTPPCPYFERCGGCDLQHLEDSAQLRLKVEAVRENLLRLGGVEMPSKVEVVAGPPWHYRLRAQLHVKETLRGREVGYFEPGSHRLVAVEKCPVLVPELEQELPRLKSALRDEKHQRIDITTGDGPTWTSSPAVDSLPRGDVEMRVGEFDYLYDARCFFQAHRQLVPRLVGHALGMETPPLECQPEEEEAFDLYAGVGLFSLPLSRHYRAVVGVEGERVAARFARKNTKRNRVQNLKIEAQAVESWISKLPRGAARVLVDPPRVGLTASIRVALVERRPRWLTYVSCDSATLARDLKLMSRGFRIESLVMLDMFPQTGHLETVVHLVDRDLKPHPKPQRPTGPE